MKKWLKVLLIVLGSIILLLAVLTVCLGPIAKVVLEKHSKELCHRVVTMDKLNVNLFTGSVGIYGLRALEEDDVTPFMSFNSLKVNIDVFPLLVKKVKLRYIKLDGPVINVTQEGYVFNFSDIIEFYRPEHRDTTPSKWLVDLRRISLTKGNICYSDLLMNSNLCMKDINVEIPRLCFGRGNSDAAMQLLFEDGGKLDVKMAYGMDKSDFTVFMKMEDFNLDPVEPYLRQWVKFKDVNGKFSADLSVSGNLKHILDLNAKGNLCLRDFNMDADRFKHVVTMDRLNVEVEDVNLEKKIYHIEAIEFDALKVNFEIDQNGSSFSSLFPSDSVKQAAEDQQAKSKKKKSRRSSKKTMEMVEVETNNTRPADIRVEHLILNDCEVNFTDRTLKKEEMTLPVSNIMVDAHNLSSSTMSKASLYAHFGKTGEFHCKWQGYLSSKGNQTIELEIKDLQMQELSPYSLHYFAYPISKGVLVYKGKTTLQNQILDSKNHFDMYNLVVEKKSKDVNPEYKLPLQAAAYVLTDMSGCAKMDLPVKGNIKNPKFSFKKIIVKAFFNTILRVAASPVDMIIQACRANADAFKDLAVGLDQNSFTSKQYDQFNAICEVMKDKPELTVIVSPSFNLANYYSDGDAKTNEKTMQEYRQLQELIHAHFAQYGITGERLQFTNKVGKKFAAKGKVLLSFDVQVPGMDDKEGMEAAEQAQEE
ncbi:MAG: DUF748 domain-containing protein [Bacteroidales bacterium]|nr:DUF748 domain-containing protein [Bacteroidales bacterium]